MWQKLALLALMSAFGLAGCASEEVLVAHSVPLARAPQTAPQHDLLDVGIVVFDPGVPAGQVSPEVKEKLMDAGTFIQVRRAESTYLAVQLRDTLQNSGRWGSVWVTPQSSTAADLDVTAKILESDGDFLRLHAKAVDSTGRVWIDKDYQIETAAGAYDRQRYPNLDPYQDAFNEIANDLGAVEERVEGTGSTMTDIRRVAALRYASDLSPQAFGSYVEAEKAGRYALKRLPASGDPMFDRTQRARQREHVFMDTLNEHYTRFANEAQDAYDGWRQSAREEAITIREQQKSARWRTGLGIASIVASVLYGSSSGYASLADRFMGDALMYMGMDMMQSAAERRRETKMHLASLEELSTSFNNDVEPLVVEINGTQHRLMGTVQAQFDEWRALLERILVSEGADGADDVKVYGERDLTVQPAVPGPDAGQSDNAGGSAEN
jgi:hypothetical protein